MSIAEKLTYIEKLTNAWVVARKRAILFIILAVFVSTLSFAAGYLVARDADQTPIIIQQ